MVESPKNTQLLRIDGSDAVMIVLLREFVVLENESKTVRIGMIVRHSKCFFIECPCVVVITVFPFLHDL